MTEPSAKPGAPSTPGSTTIRAFAAADTEAVVSLWRECELTKPWNDPYKDIARKLGVQSELFLVAVVDETIAGTVMAGYDGHRGWINYLAVSPARRRLGIGRALVAHVERDLQSKGCPKINLQIRETNTSVISFYRSIGYSPDPVVSMGRRLISD